MCAVFEACEKIISVAPEANANGRRVRLPCGSTRVLTSCAVLPPPQVLDDSAFSVPFLQVPFVPYLSHAASSAWHCAALRGAAQLPTALRETAVRCVFGGY